MIKPYTKEFFEKILKYENDAKKEMLSLKDKMNFKELKQALKKLKSIRKKTPISFDIIKTFYEQPEKFFDDCHEILENTTFFDYTGNSIFYHLFYVLYVDYKRRNGIRVLSENEKNLNFPVYESKFESFLKEYEKYFLVQDMTLDTPLHKIAKRKDKGFFIELYQKLNKINLISDELLLTNNIYNKSICTYILNEIKYNLPKIKNEEFYYNFIRDHHSIYESFSKEDQQVIKNFSSKIIFETKQYKEENFNEIFNNLNEFINNNINIPNLFEYIYFPFTSNINYLNCIFLICSKDEDYNKLFNLVSQLSKKNEIIDKICISELCIIDHIKYVIRKMGLYNRKAEQVYNYGIKLIKEILSNIMKSKDEKGIKKIIAHKRFKKGLASNVVYNQNLSFDQKIELFDLLNEITKGLLNKYIERKTFHLYRFFKFFEKKEVTTDAVEELLNKNDDFTKLIEENKYYEAIIIIDNMNDRNEDCFFIHEKINAFMEFLEKNYYNTLKYAYKISNEKIEKLLEAIYISNPNEDLKYYLDNNKYLEDIAKRFILSDKIYLKYYLDTTNNLMKNNRKLYFEYLFSSDFDLSDILNFESNTIEEFYYYLRGENEFDKIKPLIKYNLLKGKPFEACYYSFLFVISGRIQNINLLWPAGEKVFRESLSYFNRFYRRQLLKCWDRPFDYTQLAKTIEKYLLPFTKLFIYKKGLFVGILNEICPDLNLEVYIKAIDLLAENLYYQFYHGFTFPFENYDIPNNMFEELYINLILIYIKKKFDNQIPNLSMFLLVHLLKADYKKCIEIFEKSLIQGNINNFLNYIYFTEPCYSDEKYNIVNYLKNNNNSFCEALKKIKGDFNFKKYMEYLNPYIKGYAFYDDNNNSKIIPYHSYRDFGEYFESMKYDIYSNDIHIRILAYLDVKKTLIDNEEYTGNFDYICDKFFKSNCSFMDMLKEPSNKINKHLLKKIISIIEYISKETINKEFKLEGVDEDDKKVNEENKNDKCDEHKKKAYQL